METKEKIPNTIKEIVENNSFINSVKKIMFEIEQKRLKRPSPPPGKHYKRDYYDRMTDNNHFTLDYFISNINFIWIKQSNLNSEEREVIKNVCNQALCKTFYID